MLCTQRSRFNEIVHDIDRDTTRFLPKQFVTIAAGQQAL
jgi:hypothetical protein